MAQATPSVDMLKGTGAAVRVHMVDALGGNDAASAAEDDDFHDGPPP